MKLDNHFTAKAMSQTRDFELLKKIVELVHSIDIKICIEGVEKEEWYQKLKKYMLIICRAIFLADHVIKISF